MGCKQLTYYENLLKEGLRETKFSHLRVHEKGYTDVKSYVSSYAYGFNGMEKDDEVKGSGNSYDFGARMYDSRLGRWLSIDKAFSSYPNYSTYSFALDNPINFIDPTGNWIVDSQGNIVYTVNESKSFFIPQPESKRENPDGTYTEYGSFGRMVTIYTNNMTPVIAFLPDNNLIYMRITDSNGKILSEKPMSPEESAKGTPQYNCTGNALCDKKFIIFSNNITKKVLDDEGIKELEDGEIPSSGNIGIYKDKKDDKLIVHFEVFIDAKTVNSKGGNMLDPQIAKPGEAAFKNTKYLVYKDTRDDYVLNNLDLTNKNNNNKSGETTKEALKNYIQVNERNMQKESNERIRIQREALNKQN
jgi:RHS repeat-associated protein